MLDKNKSLMAVALILVLLAPGGIFAQEAEVETAEPRDRDLIGITLEELLALDYESGLTGGISIYGYMSTRLEQVIYELSVDENGETETTTPPYEWDLPYVHIFMRAPLSQNIEAFVNLASQDLEVRNAWGNIKIKDGFQLRFGKQYRTFGLFNEKLDEVPTYLGIEPPELFDSDHLMLSRTTMFTVHGDILSGKNTYSYHLTTDNGEGGPQNGVIPLGWDIRAKISGLALVGASGYFSSIGDSYPSSGTTGPSKTGILPWIENDDYQVFGGFIETQVKNLLIKAAYWQANHTAQRCPDCVLEIVREAGINEQQRERFLGENADKPDDSLTVDDVVVDVEYTIRTGYIRFGYFMYTKAGTFVPFVFFDWMEHPETIANKDFGGDNEAGISDDGIFYKLTIGLVYKPIEKVAFKLDGSTHIQKFNGQTEQYPEIRFDVSFLFK